MQKHETFHEKLMCKNIQNAQRKLYKTDKKGNQHNKLQKLY